MMKRKLGEKDEHGGYEAEQSNLAFTTQYLCEGSTTILSFKLLRQHFA